MQLPIFNALGAAEENKGTRLTCEARDCNKSRPSTEARITCCISLVADFENALMQACTLDRSFQDWWLDMSLVVKVTEPFVIVSC